MMAFDGEAYWPWSEQKPSFCIVLGGYWMIFAYFSVIGQNLYIKLHENNRALTPVKPLYSSYPVDKIQILYESVWNLMFQFTRIGKRSRYRRHLKLCTRYFIADLQTNRIMKGKSNICASITGLSFYIELVKLRWYKNIGPV